MLPEEGLAGGRLALGVARILPQGARLGGEGVTALHGCRHRLSGKLCLAVMPSGGRGLAPALGVQAAEAGGGERGALPLLPSGLLRGGAGGLEARVLALPLCDRLLQLLPCCHLRLALGLRLLLRPLQSRQLGGAGLVLVCGALQGGVALVDGGDHRLPALPQLLSRCVELVQACCAAAELHRGSLRGAAREACLG